jgi:hypothetical protein
LKLEISEVLSIKPFISPTNLPYLRVNPNLTDFEQHQALKTLQLTGLETVSKVMLTGYVA